MAQALGATTLLLSRLASLGQESSSARASQSQASSLMNKAAAAGKRRLPRRVANLALDQRKTTLAVGVS